MNNDRITDLSDVATATEEKFRESALSARKPEGPKPCGFCLNCDAPLPPDIRWCDADCRDEWEAWNSQEEKALNAGDGE